MHHMNWSNTTVTRIKAGTGLINQHSDEIVMKTLFFMIDSTITQSQSQASIKNGWTLSTSPKSV